MFAQTVVATKFKLPSPSLKSAQIGMNKFLQRQIGKKRGILQPEFKLCFSIEDVKEFLTKVDFPIILKPVDNRGSIGVSKVNNISEIEKSFFYALKNSISKSIIAEKFIEGTQIIVDGYAFDKIQKSTAVSTKILAQNKEVAVDIKYPGNLPEHILIKAKKNNEFVVNSLGFDFGFSHSECMIDKNENIYWIESATRGGGCFISEIIDSKVCGINLLDRYIDEILGKKVEVFNKKMEENPVLMKFITLKSGRIKKIEGIKEILNLKEVLAFRLEYKEGDFVEPFTTDADRHGFFIISTNEENLRNKSDEILKILKVEYENE